MLKIVRCRVCRRRLRDLLLQRCKQHGVRFRPGEVTRIGEADAAADFVTLTLGDRTTVRTRCDSSAPLSSFSLPYGCWHHLLQ